MTPYLILAIGGFLLFCESLFYWRTKLVRSHRQLARSLIIGNTGPTFWVDVERFNGHGSWEDMFWSWRWSFKSLYPTLYKTNINVL